MNYSVLLFLSFTIVLFLLLGCTNKQPNLLFINNQVMIDTLTHPSTKEFTIDIANNGGKDLKIIDFTSGCECTLINDSFERIVQKGDTIKILGVIETHNSDIGKAKFVLCTFKTNSPDVFHSIYINYFVKG